VARNIAPLRELLDLRSKLADLRGSLQGNDKLEEILQSTLNDAAAMKKLEGEMGGGGNG
jgi:type VI secretion system protein ImpB